MISPEQLALVAGIALSLAGFYLPRFGPWYKTLPSEDKAKLMGVAIVLAGIVSFVLAYFHVGPLTLPPVDLPNAIYALAMSIVAALITNQSTYTILRKLNP